MKNKERNFQKESLLNHAYLQQSPFVIFPFQKFLRMTHSFQISFLKFLTRFEPQKYHKKAVWPKKQATLTFPWKTHKNLRISNKLKKNLLWRYHISLRRIYLFSLSFFNKWLQKAISLILIWKFRISQNGTFPFTLDLCSWKKRLKICPVICFSWKKREN